jgi:signal transduction histidine kinase
VAERTQELEAFSYSVSHDLRAPLRQLAGFTELLQASLHGALNPEQARMMGKIGGSAQRMDELIIALLKLSQAGRAQINRVTIGLDTLAYEVVEGLRQGEAREVTFDAPPGLPKVDADPHLMRIAMENLIGNAWKFTARSKDARVEFGYGESPAGESAWFVRDNGAGFDPGYAQNLFVPFRRLHSELEFEGTGIGLAIVHRIVERHGGRIWAHGKPGQGAAFYFTLPSAGGGG